MWKRITEPEPEKSAQKRTTKWSWKLIYCYANEKISDSIALRGRVSANTELPFKQAIHSSISTKNKTNNKSPVSFTTVEKVWRSDFGKIVSSWEKTQGWGGRPAREKDFKGGRGAGEDVGNLNPKVTQNTSPGGRWKGGHSRIEIRNLFREHIPGNFALSKTTFITIIVVRMHKGIRLFYGRMLQQRFQTLKVTSTSPNRLGLSCKKIK